MFYPIWFDWTWLLLIPAFIITIWAQAKVSGAYKKYGKIPVRSGVTGMQFAQAMLRQNGVSGIKFGIVEGRLTDHFDPRTGTVNLSKDIADGDSVASVAVAAHECGHVLQREKKYGPMKLRNAIVPITNVCSKLAFPLILVGLIFASFRVLVDIGAWVYFAVVIFQMVTLPVEFNASKRALQNIQASGVMTVTEQAEAKKMLSAAALTYVAALLAGFLSFLRLLLISRRN